MIYTQKHGRKKQKHIILMVKRGENFYTVKDSCVTYLGNGTMLRDISEHVKQANMLTTHRAAHDEQCTRVKGRFVQTAVFFYKPCEKLTKSDRSLIWS